MSNKIIIIFFSFSKKIIFSDFADKFKPGSLKRLIDFLFRIFEKIGHNFDIISTEYLNSYREIVEKEVKLANILSNNSVLVIGCGSLPSTTVLISELTNAKIVSIDIDKKAVKSAKKIINKHGLSKKIKIELVDDLNYSVKDFDIIFILYGVRFLEEIFRYLSDKIKSDAKIIVRYHSDKFEEEFKLLDDYKIVDKVQSDALGPIFSYLIMKN